MFLINGGMVAIEEEKNTPGLAIVEAFYPVRRYYTFSPAMWAPSSPVSGFLIVDREPRRFVR